MEGRARLSLCRTGSLRQVLQQSPTPQLPSHLPPRLLHPWPATGDSSTFLVLSPDLAQSFLEMTLAASVAFGSISLELAIFEVGQWCPGHPLVG